MAVGYLHHPELAILQLSVGDHRRHFLHSAGKGAGKYLYYLTGILFLDLAGFLLNVPVSADSLNTSLFLAFATLYPETTFLVFFIIPIKARWLGILNLLIFLLQLLSFSVFPFNLLPLFALANYFLYLGKDFLNIFPINASILNSHTSNKPACIFRIYQPHSVLKESIHIINVISYKFFFLL